MRRYPAEATGTERGPRALKPATAIAIAIAACSVFEPPLAGVPDASAGASGSSGASGAVGSTAGGQSGSAGGGSGGTPGTGGTQGGGAVAGNGASDGSGGDGALGSGGAISDAGDGSSGTGGAPPLGPWWRYRNEHGCESEGLPSVNDRPSVADGPSIEPITLAMWRIRIGGVLDDDGLTDVSTAWQDIGFDYDKACTASPSCLSADAAPIEDSSCRKLSAATPADGNQCRDNALGFLFPIAASSPILGAQFFVHEQNWNCALYRGETGVLFRVSNYNGQAYDPTVRLDVYLSTGTLSLPSWSCLNPDFTINPTWKDQVPWPANKHWYVSRRSIALNAPDVSPALPNARVADPAAFVRGGYLFASLPPNAEIWLQGARGHVDGLRTVLQRAILVGRLSRTTEGWFIDDGTIQGTVLPSDEMQAFREIGFCQENMCGSFDTLRSYFNLAADALSTTGEKLPDVDCDALSIGIAFRARSATADAGDVVDSPDPVNCPPPRHPEAPRVPCADAGTDAGSSDAGVD